MTGTNEAKASGKNLELESTKDVVYISQILRYQFRNIGPISQGKVLIKLGGGSRVTREGLNEAGGWIPRHKPPPPPKPLSSAVSRLPSLQAVQQCKSIRRHKHGLQEHVVYM